MCDNNVMMNDELITPLINLIYFSKGDVTYVPCTLYQVTN